MSRREGAPSTTSLDVFMERVRAEGVRRVEAVHRLARRIWKERGWTAEELQKRCLEAWDDIGSDLGTRIKPLAPVHEDRPITDLIFGSGKFSTGEFQVAQFRAVSEYTPSPPVSLQGLVANRSEAHGCNAAKVSRRYSVPLIELDFADWYRETIDANESKPIHATRYWFSKDAPDRPPKSELARRFSIRQERFHSDLGEKIASITSVPTDIASARGYSFQLCSSLFRHQKERPHMNDTHPADLTYVDPGTKEKLYPGWQASPIQRMMEDGHGTFRGSLIEVEYMDRVDQIDELDEGALLAMGGGVSPTLGVPMSAEEVQDALKLVDDYFFCTLEPTGLILAWGVSEKPMQVTYQDLRGNPVEVKQRLVVVGDKIRSGINAWGRNLDKDLTDLETFLFTRRRTS